MTRGLCAYLEVVWAEEAARATLKKKGEAFIGPYALKIQSVGMSSTSMTEEIMVRLKCAAEK